MTVLLSYLMMTMMTLKPCLSSNLAPLLPREDAKPQPQQLRPLVDVEGARQRHQHRRLLPSVPVLPDAQLHGLSSRHRLRWISQVLKPALLAHHGLVDRLATSVLLVRILMTTMTTMLLSQWQARAREEDDERCYEMDFLIALWR